MPTQEKKTPCGIGLLAHVDAGKTTLSEALLYVSGTRRVLGRVDHGDAFLDTHTLERSRGITIFSKLARLVYQDCPMILVDTPGHVDFSAEAERTMAALDCAVLVISGTDGVQAHTATLWNLLERYGVPTILFINKMDLPGCDRKEILVELQNQFGSGCVDFTEDRDTIAENVAMCDEVLLETYLETGTVTEGNIRGLVEKRKLFPCCFGSALKLEGVDTLLSLLATYAPTLPQNAPFAARVYKISRDAQGNRLTWLKITGGTMKVRSLLHYETSQKEVLEEKLTQIRLYSGDKFTAAEEVGAGEICAVTGLSRTWAGQALGAQTHGLPFATEPVMTYRLRLPTGSDPAVVLPKLRMLEEEDPQLHLLSRNGQIHVQIMGRIQSEVFCSLVRERFGLDVALEDRRIFYKETIADTVEGVGHFEPLRHYAEVHLLLEPLPQGSGLVFDTVCDGNVLDVGYQKLILTHLEEKVHRGVLLGAPITDMKITILVGKAHLKHTEGGDMRQATYRAVRQGLMQAKSVVLEPWFAFTLTVPQETVGRAITDLRAMSGQFPPPESVGENAVLSGTVPASELRDYATAVAAYTQGRGRLQITFHAYAPCHNREEVVAAAGYDPEADVENPPDSVFCAHGSGFNVKWNRVREYMHLDSGYRKDAAPQILTRNTRTEERELEKILEREFGTPTRNLYRPPKNRPATEEIPIAVPRQKYLIVDGYNMIFGWEELKTLAREDLDAARRRLCDLLSSYAGFTKTRLVVVFDGYRQKGNPGEKTTFHNIQTVFTGEGQTCDAYIEALVHEIGGNYNIRVATSDQLIQISSFRSGVLRMSARELWEEVERTRREMRQHYQT